MIDYPARYRSALLCMVRDLLDEASESGLPGDHAFYLSFRTDAPDVGLSPTLRDLHPDTMTVVLQHQFWDLETDDEGFSVTLRFGGRPESLFVPWSALSSFVDPAAEFGVEFPELESAQEGADGAGTDTPDAAEAGGSQQAVQADVGRGEVVSLDRFRDARKPRDS